MEEFDVIVIGSGSGLNVSSAAAGRGLKVAIVEEGPFGGTCLNRGCIPSKMLIHSADVAETIRNSSKFGIKSWIEKINFQSLVKRVSDFVDNDAAMIEKGNRQSPKIKVFKTRGKFVSHMCLQVGDKTITGKKILIAAGTRPSVPPIKGLDGTPYITSDEALRLKKLPKSMTIIGGGYIAAELAHFFGSLGTKITIIQRRNVLIPNEDFEVSREFTDIYKKKFRLLLEHTVDSISYKNGKFITIAKEKEGNKITKVISEQLLVATGRKPNTDILEVEKAGVKISKHGYIEVNDCMETSVHNIWALGDIAGKYLFKHSANLESRYAYRNMFGIREKVDYTAMPHAIFASPQVAGVGMTEQYLKENKIDYTKGHYKYIDTGMGEALRDETGFVKVLADPLSGKILGCHIMGTDASTLIHEVIVAMKHANDVKSITDTVHIHPALPEVVQRAFGSVRLKS